MSSGCQADINIGEIAADTAVNETKFLGSWSSLKNLVFNYLSVVCRENVPLSGSAHRGQKKTLDPLEL